jgi:hypothetical protein
MAAVETKVAAAITPKIHAELDGALERQRSLQAAIDALSLDAVLDGKARAKLERLEGELVTATAAVSRLQKALEQAERRDAQTAAEGELVEMRSGLDEFRKLMVARERAAADLDKAVEALAEAYGRLRAGTLLIEPMLPKHLFLPRGYLRKNLHRLVSFALHKHSGVEQIGDRPLPGAIAPTFESRHDSRQIMSTEETIREETGWLLTSLQMQVDRAAQEVEAA